MTVKDLIGILGTHSNEQVKAHPEYFKPEFSKPDHFKPEFYKPDFFKEYHKEFFKPDFEKPEGVNQQGDPVERVAQRVAAIIKEQK